MLSDKELLHIASLSKISIENDFDYFKNEVNALYEEINKINDINSIDTDILISPTDNKNMATSFENGSMINIDTIKINTSNIYGNYVKVVKNTND